MGLSVQLALTCDRWSSRTRYSVGASSDKANACQPYSSHSLNQIGAETSWVLPVHMFSHVKLEVRESV